MRRKSSIRDEGHQGRVKREVHGSYTCVHCPPEPLDDAYRPTAHFGVPTLSCLDEERQMVRTGI